LPVPVIAIGGIDATKAGGCGRAGGGGGGGLRAALACPQLRAGVVTTRAPRRPSQLGGLGLLAELERRGLVERIENDAAQLGDGLVVTQDALIDGVHFRLDWLSWRDLGWRGGGGHPSGL